MTIIRPHPYRSPFAILAVALVAAIVVVGAVVVVLYNRTVNVEHRTEELQKAMEETQTASAELQDWLFTSLSGAILERIAAERGLVPDKTPSFIVVPSEHPWLASR